jgi:methyltransferase
MEMSQTLFLLLLALVGLLRLLETRLSHRNRDAMIQRGAESRPDPSFQWMVAFHTCVLAGAALEVTLLNRPLIPALAAISLALFLCTNALRWWVIRTMREHWNVSVVDSTRLGVVSGGPFCRVRHPNYAAVFVEMTALPLIHTAWLTATVGAVVHFFVLRARLRAEEAVLDADENYRRQMGAKPRFVPWKFRDS